MPKSEDATEPDAALAARLEGAPRGQRAGAYVETRVR
jgi:hypothetical protein